DVCPPPDHVHPPHGTDGRERPTAAAAPVEDDTLRMLYLGRLERRKGVQNLLRAVTALGDPRWSLTLVGGDTPTAPLRTSMRTQLAEMAAGDPRIKILGPQPRGALPELIERHHLVVVPALWECWPGV